jgi:endogenous inhibitor of DNA gyrase (YacG/DUF329 family)
VIEELQSVRLVGTVNAVVYEYGGTSVGRWKELNIPWYETCAVSCALCGQFIPRRVWVAQVAGELRSFCSRRCEKIYREYWLPRHGGTAGAEDGATGRTEAPTGPAKG